MPSLTLLKAFERKTQPGVTQALRYAVCCLLATSLAIIIQHYWQLSSQSCYFFIFTAGLATYYSFGNHWFAQSSAIMLGTFATALFCFNGILLNPYTLPLALLLVGITFCAYYLSSINPSTLFITKISIAIFCFTFDQLPSTDVHFAGQVFGAILAGGLIALVINGLVYALTPHHHLQRLSQLWFKELYRLLCQQLAQLPTSTAHFRELTDVYKQLLAEQDLERSIIIDRTGIALIELITYIQQYPTIGRAFDRELQLLLQQAATTVSLQQPQILLTQYQQFRNHIFELRKQHFFKHLPDDIRSQYIELLFLVERMVHDLANLMQHDPLHYRKRRRRLGLRLWLHNIALEIRDYPKLLNAENTKIATRAALTLLIAFSLVRYFHFQHAPWVVLSANMVLLIRQGDTIKKCSDRIFGHVIGFFIAIILGWYIWPHFYNPSFWVPLIVFPTAFYFLKNYLLFSVWLIILILYSYFIIDPIHISTITEISYISWRLLDVTVGSLIAMLAGLLIFPNVGIKSIRSLISQILDEISKHLELLKTESYHPSLSALAIINHQHLLFKQLQHAQQVLRALQFEPRRFIHDWHAAKSMTAECAKLLELITALPRRIFAAHHLLKQNPPLNALINESLNYLQQHLQCAAENAITHRPIPTQRLLERDLHQQKKMILHHADQDNISYDELINSMAIEILIAQINQQLLKFDR